MDDRNPTSDRLRRLASRYEAGVGRGRAEQIAARAITRAHRRSSVGRRLAVAVSTGAFMLVSMTGVGVAADRAVPGDFLYPLDRAMEAVGFSSDLVEERLLEAISLAERGDMVLAVETANEALDELGRSGVTATLPTATQELAVEATGTVDAPSTTTTEEVAVSSTTAAVADETDETNDDQPAPPADAAVESTEAVDAVANLRLAAEQLLQSVRSAKSDPSTTGDVTTAALFLAETTAGVTGETESADTSTSTSSSTSTTSTSSTTSTTIREEPRPGNGNGNGQNSGTTTTTVASDPDDGSGSDDSTDDGEDGSPGPIFLPAP